MTPRLGVLAYIFYPTCLALMEATDADLQQIHLPKGPRIKILKSMESRRQQMEHAIEVNESGDTQF